MTYLDTVRSVVQAINTRDREQFFVAFIDPDSVRMTDDGNVREFESWAEHEVFSAQNTLTVFVENESGNVIHVEGEYQTAQWGTFRTFWNFTFDETGKIVQMDVGAL